MKRLLVQILSNKILLLIIFLFFGVAYLVYSIIESNNFNSSLTENKIIDPYLLVTKGSAFIKRDKVITLKEKQKENIFINDKIRTFSDSSATIFWPDGSITRLGSKTVLEINEIKTNKELSEINIKFNLEQGKTWSNVVKFFTGKSYFKETYDFGNYAATVRGTVFEMNLEKNYVHAVNHDVDIVDEKSKKVYNISEGLALSSKNPKDKVGNELFDSQWIEENLKFDKEYIGKLSIEWNNKISKYLGNDNALDKLSNSLSNSSISKTDYIIKEIGKGMAVGNNMDFNIIKDEISGLDDNQKLELNSKLMAFYQNIHSQPNTPESSLQKSEIRSLIIDSAKEEDKQDLNKKFVKLDIYDYAELQKDNIKAGINDTSKTIEKLKENIKAGIEKIEDKSFISELLSGFSSYILEALGINTSRLNKDMDIIIEKFKSGEVKKKLKKDLIDKAKDINNTIDNIIGK